MTATTETHPLVTAISEAAHVWECYTDAHMDHFHWTDEIGKPLDYVVNTLVKEFGSVMAVLAGELTQDEINETTRRYKAMKASWEADKWAQLQAMIEDRAVPAIDYDRYAREWIDLLTAPSRRPVSGGLTVLRVSDLLSRPAPEWLVGDFLQTGRIGVLAGPPGLGKSFLCLDWALSIASGTDWAGRAVKPGRVIYVAAEGADSFGLRVQAWQAARSIKVPEDRIGFIEAGVNMSNAESMDALADVLAAEDADLVILDTMSQLADMDNENDAAQVARVMRTARTLREARPGCSVLLVHHTGKSATSAVRGSSAIRGNADTVIVARGSSDGWSLSTRSEDDGKQKDGHPIKLGGFRLVSSAESAVVEWYTTNPEWDAMLEVLGDDEWHPTADVLAACGIFSGDDNGSKRIRRMFGSAKLVESKGSTRDMQWRRIPDESNPF